MLILCYTCKQQKPSSEFYFHKKRNVWHKECHSCKLTRKRNWKLANLERVKQVEQTWKDNNWDKHLAYSRKSHHKNKDWQSPHRLAAIKKWQQEKLARDPTYNTVQFRKWCAKFPEKARLHSTAHQQRCRAQQPPWVNRKEINNIYKNCPLGYHVDHIMPLRGKLSWGLHVPWNLQYLPAKINLKKSNKILEVINA